VEKPNSVIVYGYNVFPWAHQSLPLNYVCANVNNSHPCRLVECNEIDGYSSGKDDRTDLVLVRVLLL